MTTYATKPSDIERKWYVVDAQGVVLGRLAAEVAKILRGKHKPYFVPNLDCGDYVIVINAEKVGITGNKLENNKFFWHTAYIGGIKQVINGNANRMGNGIEFGMGAANIHVQDCYVHDCFDAGVTYQSYGSESADPSFYRLRNGIREGRS